MKIVISALLMCFATGVSLSAGAQEVGILGGFHSTGADSKTSGTSIDNKVNFRLGVPIAFELVDKTKFRTGFIYTQRHVDVSGANFSGTINYEYIDIPAMLQYQVHEMFGVFGGLTMALNMKKSITGIPGMTKADGTESIIPLATVGVTTLFNDMIGFDFYYERGFGKVSKDVENFSTFGANFIYWIY
jgi:hypothetical protein